MRFRFRDAPITALLLLAIGGMFLVETWAGGSTDARVLLALGANDPGAVLGEGEWWRLVTSMFLHIGFLHLLLNGWALYQLGALFEMTVGSIDLLIVYFVSGVAGSAASLWWTQELSAGASGAIFGLLGFLIAYLLRYRQRLNAFGMSLLSQLVAWAVINVSIGFTIPMIDNAAHLGGCAAGFLLGLVLRGSSPRAI